MSHRVIIPGTPRPWRRPGGNGRRYTEQADAEWRDVIGWALRQDIRDPFEGPVSMVLTFTSGQTSVLVDECPLPRRPGLRADLDNLTKLVLDGAQGVVYENDRQVTALSARFVAPEIAPKTNDQ